VSILALFEPEGLVAGLAAIGVNLFVAFGLITLSVLLGAAVFLLAALPAVAIAAPRAVRARANRRMTK